MGGMLSAIAMAAKFIQTTQKLPKIAKFCQNLLN